jgi:hypothetical protein
LPSVPLMNPRMLWFCQSVAFAISPNKGLRSVGPRFARRSGRFSLVGSPVVWSNGPSGTPSLYPPPLRTQVADSRCGRDCWVSGHRGDETAVHHSGCVYQRHTGRGGGSAEVVIERGKRQALANCQFQVGGIVGAEPVSPRQRQNLLSEPGGWAMRAREREPFPRI